MDATRESSPQTPSSGGIAVPTDGRPLPLATRPLVIALAFAIHLIAWEGYIALSTATANFSFGNAWAVWAGLGAAVVSAAAAVVIGRVLRGRTRLVFTVASLVVLVFPGVIDLIRLLPVDDSEPTGSGLLDLVFSPLIVLCYAGTLLYPFLLAGVLVLARGPRSTRPVFIVRLSIVIACAGLALAAAVSTLSVGVDVFAEEVVPVDTLWGQPGFDAAIASAVGLIAIVTAVRFGADVVVSSALTRAVNVVAYAAVALGILLCTLSTASVVYTDSIGIGGTGLWMALVVLAPILLAGAALLGPVAVIAGRRSRRR